jgi:MYXO-CTERM domain-containing protein
MDPATGGKCVPRFLGVEGRVNLGALLGSFGAPADAQMDLSLAAGSSVTVDQGATFGTRAGIQPVKVASCVPPAAAPAMPSVSAPNFDGEATPGSMYHVGLGLSSSFLNRAFWAAHQAGALCLQLSTENVGLINTGLFKTFLPSLGRLATRDGKDAPMMVVLRPARPPQVTVGQGTYDPITKKPIKPLLLLTLPDLSIDFYAMLDDRQARLFTLTADISLPLSLIFEGCDKVTPAIGDLKTLISNIRTANSEMLAEDPQVLADLVPAIVGLAEPALARGLSGFALPPLGPFKLKVNEVKGLGNIAGTEAYNHLGLYAQLMDVNAMCAVSAPRLHASLEAGRMPRAAEMRATGQHALPWPEAVLRVEALGKPGTPEYSVKIDDGLWSDFRPADGNSLVVSHPRFLLQGQHTIWVRARVAEDPHGISAPQQVGFLVDWEPPEVSLAPDRQTDRLEVRAHDVVSADAKLVYAYRVGDGPVSDFGEAREIRLSAVEAQGGVTVLVRDEAGNVGEATWRVPTMALRHENGGDLVATSPAATQSGGCAAIDGPALLGLFALVGLLHRRRR